MATITEWKPVAIFTDESEFFTVLAKMIKNKVCKSTEQELVDVGLEEIIRGAIRFSLTELMDNGLIPNDSRVPPQSLANLVDISLEEPGSPKINMWPLVSILYPLANIKVTGDVTLKEKPDGGTLDEAINGGRYIDLS